MQRVAYARRNQDGFAGFFYGRGDVPVDEGHGHDPQTITKGEGMVRKILATE